MRCRTGAIVVVICLTLFGILGLDSRKAHADTPTAEQVTAFTNQTATWTIIDWINWDRLVSWNLLTANWTIIDWIQFSRMSEALLDNEAANRGDVNAIHRVIQRVWGSDSYWAFTIVQRESGFNPAATNPSSGACGLFQMLGHENMFVMAGLGGRCHEAVANIIVARTLFEAAGRSPWASTG